MIKIFKNKYLKTAIKLDNILKKADLNFIDKFEKEFNKLEHKKETTAMIVFGNRELVRNAYYMTVMLNNQNKENSNLFYFNLVVNNIQDTATREASCLSKLAGATEEILFHNDFIAKYFYEYGDTSRRRKNERYIYSLPTRVISQKLVDSLRRHLNKKQAKCIEKQKDEMKPEETSEINEDIKIIEEDNEDSLDIEFDIFDDDESDEEEFLI